MKMSFVVEARIEIIPWQDYSVLEEGPVIHCENLLLIYNDLVIEDLFDSALSINQWVLEDDSDNNCSVISPYPGALDLLRTQLEQVLIPQSAQKSPIDNDRRSEGSSNLCQSDETCCSNGNITEPEKSELTWSSNGTGYEFAHVRLESLSDDVFYSENLKKSRLSLHDVNSLSSIDYSLSGSSTTQDSYRLSSTTNSSSLDSNQSSDLSDFSSLHIRHLFVCSSESEVERTEEFMSSPDSLKFEHKRSDKNRLSQDSESSLEVIFENMEACDSAPGSKVYNQKTSDSLEQTQTFCSNKEEPPPIKMENTQSEDYLKRKDPDITQDSRSEDQDKYEYIASGDNGDYEKDIAANSGDAQTMPSDVPCVLDTELHETYDTHCDSHEQVDTHSNNTVHCETFELEETGVHGPFLQDSEQNTNTPSRDAESETLKYNAQNNDQENTTYVPRSDLIAEELKQNETVSKSDFPCFDGLDFADNEECCPMLISEESQDTIQTVVSALNQDTAETIPVESSSDLEDSEYMITTGKIEVDNNKDASVVEKNLSSPGCTANELYIDSPEQKINRDENQSKELVPCVDLDILKLRETEDVDIKSFKEENIEENENLSSNTLVSDKSQTDEREHVTGSQEEDSMKYGLDKFKESGEAEPQDQEFQKCFPEEFSFNCTHELKDSEDWFGFKATREAPHNTESIASFENYSGNAVACKSGHTVSNNQIKEPEIQAYMPQSESQHDYQDDEISATDKTEHASSSAGQQYTYDTRTYVGTDIGVQSLSTQTFVEESFIPFLYENYQVIEQDNTTDEDRTDSQLIEKEISAEAELNKIVPESEENVLTKLEANIPKAVHEKDEDTREICEEIVRTTELQAAFEETTTVHEDYDDTIELRDEIENTLERYAIEDPTDLCEKLLCTSEICDNFEHTEESCEKSEGTTEVHKEIRDILELHGEIEDKTEVCNEMKDKTELHEEVEDALEVCKDTTKLHGDLRGYISELHEEFKDTTELCDEVIDTIDLLEQVEDTPEVCEKFDGITELRQTNETTTKLCEEMEDTVHIQDDIEDTTELHGVLHKETTKIFDEDTIELHEEIENTSKLLAEIEDKTELSVGIENETACDTECLTSISDFVRDIISKSEQHIQNTHTTYADIEANDMHETNALEDEIKIQRNIFQEESKNTQNLSEGIVDIEEMETANTSGDSNIGTDTSPYEYEDVKSDTNHMVNSDTKCLTNSIETDKPCGTKTIVKVHEGVLDVIEDDIPQEQAYKVSCTAEENNALVTKIDRTGNLKSEQIIFEKQLEIKELCSEIVEDMMNAIFEISNQDGSMDVGMIRDYSDLTPERDTAVNESIPENFLREEIEIEDSSKLEQQAKSYFEYDDLPKTFFSSQEMRRKNSQNHCAINIPSLCKDDQFTNANTSISVTSISSAELVENTEIGTEYISEAFDTLEGAISEAVNSDHHHNLGENNSSIPVEVDPTSIPLVEKELHAYKTSQCVIEKGNEIETNEIKTTELPPDSLSLDTEECSSDENVTEAQVNSILYLAIDKQSSAEKDFVEGIISEIETSMRNVEDEIKENETSVEGSEIDRTCTLERNEEVQKANAINSVFTLSDEYQSTDVSTEDKNQALAHDSNSDRGCHLEKGETLDTMCSEKDDKSIETEIKIFLEDIISNIVVDMSSLENDVSVESIESEGICIPERNEEIPIENEIAIALPFSDHFTKVTSTQDNNQDLSGDPHVDLEDYFKNIETSITICNETVNKRTEDPVEVNESLVENVESAAEREQALRTENKSIIVLPFGDKYQDIDTDNVQDNIVVSAGDFEEQLNNVEEFVESCTEIDDRRILKVIKVNQLPVEAVELDNESVPEQDEEWQVHETSQQSPNCGEENFHTIESFLEGLTDQEHISISTNKDILYAGIKPDSCYFEPTESVPDICSIFTKTNAQYLDNLVDDKLCSNDCKTVETELDHDGTELADLNITKNECDIQDIVIEDIWSLFRDSIERNQSGDRDDHENGNHVDANATFERHDALDYNGHKSLMQEKYIEEKLGEQPFKENAIEEKEMEIGNIVDCGKYEEEAIVKDKEEMAEEDACADLSESIDEYFSEVASDFSEVNLQNKKQLVQEIYTGLGTFNRDDIPFDIQKGIHHSEASSLGIDKFLSEGDENFTERHSLTCIEEESEVFIDEANIENYIDFEYQAYDTASYLMPIMEESFSEMEDSSENGGKIYQIEEFKKGQDSEYRPTAVKQSGNFCEFETSLLEARAESKDNISRYVEPSVETQVGRDEYELEKENVDCCFNDAKVNSLVPACQQTVSLNKSVIQNQSKQNKASGINGLNTVNSEYEEDEIIPEKIERHEALSAIQIELVFGIQTADRPISDLPDMSRSHSKTEHDMDTLGSSYTNQTIYELKPDTNSSSLDDLTIQKQPEALRESGSNKVDFECEEPEIIPMIIEKQQVRNIFDIQSPDRRISHKPFLSCDKSRSEHDIDERACPNADKQSVFEIKSGAKQQLAKQEVAAKLKGITFDEPEVNCQEETLEDKHLEEQSEQKCQDNIPKQKWPLNEPDQHCPDDETEQKLQMEEQGEECQIRQDGEPENMIQGDEQEQACQGDGPVLLFQEEKPNKACLEDELELICQEEEPERMCQKDQPKHAYQKEKPMLMIQEAEQDKLCEEETSKLICQEKELKQNCQKDEPEQLYQKKEQVLTIQKEQPEHSYEEEEPELLCQEEEQEQKCQENEQDEKRKVEKPEQNHQVEDTEQICKEEQEQTCQEEEPQQKCHEDKPEYMCQEQAAGLKYQEEQLEQIMEPEQNYQEDGLGQMCQEPATKPKFQAVELIQIKEPEETCQEEEPREVCQEEISEIKCHQETPENKYQEVTQKGKFRDMAPEEMCPEETPEEICHEKESVEMCLEETPENNHQKVTPEEKFHKEIQEEKRQEEEQEAKCQEEIQELYDTEESEMCHEEEAEEMRQEVVSKEMCQDEVSEETFQKEELEEKYKDEILEERCHEERLEETCQEESREMCQEEESDKACQEEGSEETCQAEEPQQKYEEETQEEIFHEEESVQGFQEETPEDKCQEEASSESSQEETSEEVCQEVTLEEKIQEQTPEEKFQEEDSERKCTEEYSEEKCHKETPGEKCQEDLEENHHKEMPEEKCHNETASEKCCEATPGEMYQKEIPEEKCQYEKKEEKCQMRKSKENCDKEESEEECIKDKKEEVCEEDGCDEKCQEEELEETCQDDESKGRCKEEDHKQSRPGEESKHSSHQEEPEEKCQEEEPESKYKEEQKEISQVEDQEQLNEDDIPEIKIAKFEKEQKFQDNEADQKLHEKEPMQICTKEEPEQICQDKQSEQTPQGKELEQERQDVEPEQMCQEEEPEQDRHEKETEEYWQENEFLGKCQEKEPEQTCQGDKQEQGKLDEEQEKYMNQEDPQELRPEQMCQEEQDCHGKESKQELKEKKRGKEIQEEEEELNKHVGDYVYKEYQPEQERKEVERKKTKLEPDQGIQVEELKQERQEVETKQEMQEEKPDQEKQEQEVEQEIGDAGPEQEIQERNQDQKIQEMESKQYIQDGKPDQDRQEIKIDLDMQEKEPEQETQEMEPEQETQEEQLNKENQYQTSEQNIEVEPKQKVQDKKTEQGIPEAERDSQEETPEQEIQEEKPNQEIQDVNPEQEMQEEIPEQEISEGQEQDIQAKELKQDIQAQESEQKIKKEEQEQIFHEKEPELDITKEEPKQERQEEEPEQIFQEQEPEQDRHKVEPEQKFQEEEQEQTCREEEAEQKRLMVEHIYQKGDPKQACQQEDLGQERLNAPEQECQEVESEQGKEEVEPKQEIHDNELEQMCQEELKQERQENEPCKINKEEPEQDIQENEPEQETQEVPEQETQEEEPQQMCQEVQEQETQEELQQMCQEVREQETQEEEPKKICQEEPEQEVHENKLEQIHQEDPEQERQEKVVDQDIKEVPEQETQDEEPKQMHKEDPEQDRLEEEPEKEKQHKKPEQKCQEKQQEVQAGEPAQRKDEEREQPRQEEEPEQERQESTKSEIMYGCCADVGNNHISPAIEQTLTLNKQLTTETHAFDLDESVKETHEDRYVIEENKDLNGSSNDVRTSLGVSACQKRAVRDISRTKQENLEELKGEETEIVPEKMESQEALSTVQNEQNLENQTKERDVYDKPAISCENLDTEHAIYTKEPSSVDDESICVIQQEAQLIAKQEMTKHEEGVNLDQFEKLSNEKDESLPFCVEIEIVRDSSNASGINQVLSAHQKIENSEVKLEQTEVNKASVIRGTLQEGLEFEESENILEKKESQEVVLANKMELNSQIADESNSHKPDVSCENSGTEHETDSNDTVYPDKDNQNIDEKKPDEEKTSSTDQSKSKVQEKESDDCPEKQSRDNGMSYDNDDDVFSDDLDDDDDEDRDTEDFPCSVMEGGPVGPGAKLRTLDQDFTKPKRLSIINEETDNDLNETVFDEADIQKHEERNIDVTSKEGKDENRKSAETMDIKSVKENHLTAEYTNASTRITTKCPDQGISQKQNTTDKKSKVEEHLDTNRESEPENIHAHTKENNVSNAVNLAQSTSENESNKTGDKDAFDNQKDKQIKGQVQAFNEIAQEDNVPVVTKEQILEEKSELSQSSQGKAVHASQTNSNAAEDDTSFNSKYEFLLCESEKKSTEEIIEDYEPERSHSKDLVKEETIKHTSDIRRKRSLELTDNYSTTQDRNNQAKSHSSKENPPDLTSKLQSRSREDKGQTSNILKKTGEKPKTPAEKVANKKKDIMEPDRIPEKLSPGEGISQMFMSNLTADLSRRVEYNRGWRLHSSSSLSDSSSGKSDSPSSKMISDRQNSMPTTSHNKKISDDKIHSSNNQEISFDSEQDKDQELSEHYGDRHKDQQQPSKRKTETLSFESGEYVISHDESCSDHSPDEQSIDTVRENPYKNMSKEEKRSTFRQASTQYNTVIYVPKKTEEAEVWHSRESDEGLVHDTRNTLRKSVDETSKHQESRGRCSSREYLAEAQNLPYYGREQEVHMMQPEDNQKTPHSYGKRSDSYPDRSTGKDQQMHKHRSLQSSQDYLYDSKDQLHEAREQEQAFQVLQASKDMTSDYDVSVQNRQSRSFKSDVDSYDQEVEDVWVVNRASRRASADSRGSSADSRRASVESRASVDGRALVDSRRASVESRASIDRRTSVDSRTASIDSRASLDGTRVSLDRGEEHNLAYKKGAQRSDSESSGSVQSRADHRQRSDTQSPGVRMPRSDSQSSSGSLQGRRPSDHHSLFTKARRSDSGPDRSYTRRMSDRQSPYLRSRRSDSESSESFQERVYERRIPSQHSPSMNARRSDSESSGSHASKTGAGRVSDQQSPSVKARRSDSDSSEPQQNKAYNRRLSDHQSSSLQSKRSDSESSGSLQDRGYTRRPSDQQLQQAGIGASRHRMIHEENNQQKGSSNYLENETQSEMRDYPHGYDPRTRQSRDVSLDRQSPHVPGRRLSLEEKSKSEAKLWSQVEDVKPSDQLPYELTQSYDSSIADKHFGQSLEKIEKKAKAPRAHFSDEYIQSREFRNDQNNDFESEQQKKQRREYYQDDHASTLSRGGQKSKEYYDFVQSEKLPRKSYSETHRQGPDSSGNQPGSRRDSHVEFSGVQTGSRRGSRQDRPDDHSSLRRSSQDYIAGSQSGVRRGSHVQTGSQAESMDLQSRSRSQCGSKVDSTNKQQQYLEYPEADFEQQGKVQTSSRRQKMPSVDRSPSRPDILHTSAENLKYSRQHYDENAYLHSGRELEASLTNQTNKKPSRSVKQEEKLAYSEPQRSNYPNNDRRDSNIRAGLMSQASENQTLWLVDDQGNRVKVDKYLYEMKIKDDEDRAQHDRRRSIHDRDRANARDQLRREDDRRRDTYSSGEKVGDRKSSTGNYRTVARGSRVQIKDGPLSLTDAYGQMENHNNNMAGHALSQSTNHLSGSMTSLSNKHAPSASPSRQSTLQKQQSLQSVTSEMNGGPREEDRIKFERLKNLSEDDLMVKIKEIVSHFERLEDFHRGDGMRIQKMLGDMYWDYTHMREMIGDCMAESGYAGLAMNMLKTLNGIGIFKNDDVWFPTYYTYNTMWNFTDASSKLALALSEHDAVRLLTLNCGHKPYIQALHSKNVYYVIKASLSVLHNIARNSGMKHLFDDNKTSETIMPFLESEDEMLKILATLTISNIVDEEENKALITETGTVKCMVSWIEKALGLPRRRYKGFTPQELTEGLNKLAVNDSNKLKIVEEGALLLFLKMLQHDDVREQSSAARVIWTLSFDKEVREKIKEVSELMAQLEKLTESTNKSLQTNSTGALWVIKGENDVSKENEDDPVPKRRAKSARTKTHVFLSYSWSDKETVLQIRDRLRAEGYALWIDIEKMGGSTLEAMSTAVENSAVVLICMSEKYKQSPNCRTEAEYTFQLRKDYIPIMMQKKYRPDGWLGIILGAKLYFDFSGKYPFDKSFQGLVKELRGRGKVTPNQTPGETNDNTDAAIIHSTSLSSHASYGTPVHQVPSNSVIHTMGQEELIKWLRNIKLTDCIPAFMEFDGRLLMQLKMMRSEAPEFFYQCLEKRLNMSLIEILKFTRALEELH